MTRTLENSTPASPWRSLAVAIDKIAPETRGVATYHLRFCDPADAGRYRFQPGQFNMLYLPGVGEAAISLSDNPSSSQTLSHTIRVAGNVTRSLAALRPGDTLGLRGPFGNGWPLEVVRGADVVLVAGGIGLAPLRTAIYHLLAQRSDYGTLTLLYGARTPEDLLFAPQHAEWIDRGLSVQTTVDRPAAGWEGRMGVVTQMLARLPLARPADTVVFTCGPEVMMKYVIRTAATRGITAKRIWCALERNMQCAVGLCGHCMFGSEFICKDGPVLRADRVMPLLSVQAL
jgi:NAD(P)H-flavin reductase